MFIICRFELEHTAFMELDRIYMVKGIYDNIDTLVSYEVLPKAVITSIIPFKNTLIYDGILSGLPLDLGVNFEKELEKKYNLIMKYYHL